VATVGSLVCKSHICSSEDLKKGYVLPQQVDVLCAVITFVVEWFAMSLFLVTVAEA
jgi:hypothetical protein